jgi:HEAT repeat protein
VPNLVELLKSEEEADRRAQILQILGGIGPQAEPAAVAAGEALDDPDRNVAITAAYCLGKIGPPAKAAVPALRKLLDSEDKIVRLTGTWALLQIGPRTEPLVETALPVLTDALNHEQEFVRLEAAVTLGEIGKSAEAALPALETAARDRSPLVRRAAAEAARKIR